MIYTSSYDSPLGKITLANDEEVLIGLWFEGQKYFGSTITSTTCEVSPIESPMFSRTKNWLDTYFSGKIPNFLPQFSTSDTMFRLIVWKFLLDIPYGKTRTYRDIARSIAVSLGTKCVAPQAIGNAVSRNPISLIIPCHRVIGANGSLTGYAGGIAKKASLLKLEGAI